MAKQAMVAISGTRFMVGSDLVWVATMLTEDAVSGRLSRRSPVMRDIGSDHARGVWRRRDWHLKGACPLFAMNANTAGLLRMPFS